MPAAEQPGCPCRIVLAIARATMPACRSWSRSTAAARSPTSQKIQQVADKVAAAKAAGKDVVVVVSAMGDTTDELLALAKQVSESPARRELDMLLSAGERISMALLSMALNARGVPGRQLHRLAVRDRDERRAHERAHRRGAPVPRAGRAGARQGRDRRRLPGRLLQEGGHDARPRRLGHDGGRARGGARGRLRDLQRRRRRLHGGPARRARGAPARRSSATRRCRSWPSPGPRC